ncbi:MAG TPA: hypothetical protein VED84_06025 [Acidimicrobiales bacterium]|nr:hypothetical protein [Acidimicrobiales bacterium]
MCGEPRHPAPGPRRDGEVLSLTGAGFDLGPASWRGVVERGATSALFTATVTKPERNAVALALT